ncbi:hypothetical protein WN48_03296 [Eufriesea mexicana]|uniref:Uncharacterized protein n=1 Tax=Eufriesea mexicana TaxID=516756 RepID=A0A310SJP3_9HYME|nr:hypothetical protein WN48_03296 [Eufriesea mexicana]
MNPATTVEEETSSSLPDAITSSSLSRPDSPFSAAVTRCLRRSKTDRVTMYTLPHAQTHAHVCTQGARIAVFCQEDSIDGNQMVLPLTSACLEDRLYFPSTFPPFFLHFRLSFLPSYPVEALFKTAA